MTRRMVFPLLLGVTGAVILIGLGIWQVQRLAWKEGILARIEARISAAPQPLPAAPDTNSDNYLAVVVDGELFGPELHVLTSRKPEGPGFRVVRGFEARDGRRLLADLGYVSEAEKGADRAGGAVRIEGNLIWPDETDGFTPEPNLERNIWFARDVGPMAEALKTEPLMIALRASEPQLSPRPMPVTLAVPNDHLEYAITWFSLAVVWIGMTLYLLWRIKRASDDRS